MRFSTFHKPTHQSGFRWLILISRTWAETIFRFPTEKSKNRCSFSETVLFPWYIDLEVICSRGHYYKLEELWGTIGLYTRVSKNFFLYKATEIQRLREYNSIIYCIGNANTITSFLSFFFFLLFSTVFSWKSRIISHAYRSRVTMFRHRYPIHSFQPKVKVNTSYFSLSFS